MPSSVFSRAEIDDVTLLTMDDGKANAFTTTWADDLDSQLSEIERGHTKAIVLSGGEGLFSAGFDLSIMANGPDAALPVIQRNGEVLMRLFAFPKPVVIACTGHAVAGGAVLLLLGDYRLAAEFEYKIGFNEVAIGLPLPGFAYRPATARLAPQYWARALSNAEIFSPTEARAAGFIDALVDPDQFQEAAVESARSLSSLNTNAFALTKRRLRSSIVETVLAELPGDIESIRPFLRT